MKYLFAFLAVACLTVTGCTTTDIDATVQKSLPGICSAAATAKPALDLAIETGKVTGKKAAAVEAAYASLEPLCAAPGSQTAASVLVAATTAYLTISDALRTAQK